MKFGVSSASLYPLKTEDAFLELAKRGIKNVEVFLNSLREGQGEILEKMLATQKEYGINVTSMHPFSSPIESVFLFSYYERRTEDLLEMYNRYFEAMNRLSAKIFVIHGAIRSSGCSEEHYFEQFYKLYKLAKSHGIMVAQENISYCKSSDLTFLSHMATALGDDAKFVLDIKQALRSGYTATEMLDTLGTKIVHIHVSDNKPGADCLPIGEGIFDFHTLLRKLHLMGFDGSLMVELYRENYKEYDDLSRCITTLQAVYSEIIK